MFLCARLWPRFGRSCMSDSYAPSPDQPSRFSAEWPEGRVPKNELAPANYFWEGNLRDETQDICVKPAENHVAKIVYKNVSFPQPGVDNIKTRRLSPIPSTMLSTLHTICTRLFHTPFRTFTPVDLQFYPPSTGTTITTTIYK